MTSASASARVELPGNSSSVAIDTISTIEDIRSGLSREDIEDLAMRQILEYPESRTDATSQSPRITTMTLERPSIARLPVTLLAEWNGCVESMQEHQFTASLKGVFGEGVSGEEEDAEIPISDVGESDKELLRLGNYFRLCVFYEIRDNGQPRRYTQVVFRRLPAYRAADLARAEERAEEMHRVLRVE